MSTKATGEVEVEVHDPSSRAIELYSRSVEQDKEDDEDDKRQPQVRSKKRSYLPVTPVSDEISAKRSSKISKIPIYDSNTDQGDASFENYSRPLGTGEELAKKRLASRVSSRRTREREKLRMDHFRSAKINLLQENKKLSEDNQRMRSLILKLRSEKALRDHTAAGARSMLSSHNQGAVPLLAAPVAAQQQFQPDITAMLLKALAQNMNPPQAPSMPSQELQLLALLGLVANNSGLAHMVGQLQQTQLQQHPVNLIAALQGNAQFGAPIVPNQGHTLQQQLLSLLMSQGAGANH